MAVGVLAVAAAVTLSLAGCGDTGSGAGAVADGTYLAADTSTFAVVPGTRVTVVVDGTRLGASAGCNTLGGSWRLDGDRLVVDDLAATMMGCAPDLADQDARLGAVLTSRPVVAASADGFTLTADDATTLVLVDRRVADPDVPVTQTPWQLTTVTTADAATSAAGFDTVVVRLDAGVLTVTTACATGSTTYVPAGVDTYDVAPLELTDTASPGDGDCTDGVLEAQQALVDVLAGRVTATVEARTLAIAGDGMTLGFVAA